MRLFVWNCQGAASKSFFRTFKHFVPEHRPQVVVLVEPRIAGTRADNFIKKSAFQFSYRIEAQGFSGGIWILWNDLVEIQIIGTHFQFIHMKVKPIGNVKEFYFTTVYGSPNSLSRKELWRDLQLLSQMISDPWILAGW